jgi:hypothetical protein
MTVRNPVALDSLIYILLHPLQLNPKSNLNQYKFLQYPVTPLLPTELFNRILVTLVNLAKLSYLNFSSINAHEFNFLICDNLRALDTSSQVN